MTLSSSFGETLSYSMTIGKAGQQPRSFLTGVPCVQRSSRLRRDGDANMRYRHLRQTCTSCHSKLVCSRKTPRPRSVLHRSNISSRTQPGSVWIDVGFLWFWSVPCTSQQPFHVPNGNSNTHLQLMNAGDSLHPLGHRGARVLVANRRQKQNGGEWYQSTWGEWTIGLVKSNARVTGQIGSRGEVSSSVYERAKGMY